MAARPAGGYDQPLTSAKDVGDFRERLGVQRAGLSISGDGRSEGLRLFVDLLEHRVRIASRH